MFVIFSKLSLDGARRKARARNRAALASSALLLHPEDYQESSGALVGQVAFAAFEGALGAERVALGIASEDPPDEAREIAEAWAEIPAPERAVWMEAAARFMNR